MKAQSRFRKPVGLISLLVMAALMLAACSTGEIPATGGTVTVEVPQPADTMAPVEPTDSMELEATATTAPTRTQAATMAPSPTEEMAAGEEAEISVVDDPQFGEILVGNNGMTLYMFTRDEPNQVNCEGECLVNWPPLVTQGDPVLGEGVDPDLVGTAPLPDGSMIVTYNEMPLYYWIADTEPGQTTGQGVGGVWYVVSSEGEAIGADMAAETPEGSATETPEGETMGEGEAMMEGEAVIDVATHPEFGEILVGSDGMTLYIFTRDEPNQVNCTGDCLVNWPPLTTEGNPQLGEGVDESLVGTADLPDGSQIVTYNGMPLYYWVNDAQPGDATGQGVGDVWYVISPEGEVIGQ